MSHNTIKNLPISQNPYDKCVKSGVGSLTDSELLAIIINSGTANSSAIDIAQCILSCKHGNLLNLYEFSMEELMEFKGIGRYKAIRLLAIAELSMRISKTNMGNYLIMNNPKTVAAYYMEQLRHLHEEQLFALYMDSQCKLIKEELIAKGNRKSALFSKGLIFEKALLCKASMIILLHNHPSGNCIPSNDDIKVTQEIIQGAKLLDLDLIDHIIIGDNKYYSFKENDLI